MSAVLDVVAVLLCGVLDRVRGAPWPKIPDIIEGVLYAIPVYYLIIGTIDWLFIPFGILFWAGTKFGGWGHPMNQALFGDLRHDLDSEPEWWQFGIFLDNPWAALMLRGFMWGAPFIPMAYWVPEVLAVGWAFAIAMPLACYLARELNELLLELDTSISDVWAVQEYLCGWIVGLILVVAL